MYKRNIFNSTKAPFNAIFVTQVSRLGLVYYLSFTWLSWWNCFQINIASRTTNFINYAVPHSQFYMPKLNSFENIKKLGELTTMNLLYHVFILVEISLLEEKVVINFASRPIHHLVLIVNIWSEILLGNTCGKVYKNSCHF